MIALVVLVSVLAAGPAFLFLGNLRHFQPPRLRDEPATNVSILIPARDEARNIQAAIDAALSNEGAEVIVLDDGSTDGTLEMIEREPRVHLLRGRPLPNEWCGKPWACAQLAEAATRPWLLFVDADVRVGPRAASSMAHWMREERAQLASGVPRQEFGSFLERLLIPLIHFVLLGFLPLQRMRASHHPAYATGCGQLIMVDAKAYRESGGHAAIRNRLHDGLALPKAFREAGFRTDLFDATTFASCRMYRSALETWRGLSRNAHEGLGAPARILPATLLLSGGQVLPFVLLLSEKALWLLPAVACIYLTRMIAARRFHQPLDAALLHPLAIVVLLAMQWCAFLRSLRGSSTNWKGRAYQTA